MLRKYLPLLLIIHAGMAMGQNLVLNPSFEDTVNCEDQLPYSLLKARHWSSPNLATPDLYDCYLERQCGEPMNPNDTQGVVIQGFQSAYHGDRFGAGFQWYGPGVPPDQDTRDYLMVELSEELQAGDHYGVSLYYSRAEGYRYAIDKIGVFFGPDSIFEDHSTVLSVAPQVLLEDPTNAYLTEGENWIQLTDTFIAFGGERWMVIGTFNWSDEVDGIDATPTSNAGYAYYYFDQVSVVPLERPIGIPEYTIWYAGYDMVGIDWKGTETIGSLRLYDALGNRLMEIDTQLKPGSHTLKLPNALATGIYLVEILSSKGRQVRRLMKEEGMF